MRKFFTLLVFMGSFGGLILGLHARAAEQPVACPDMSLGETQEDCPWAAISRSLSQEAAQDKILEPEDLKEASPELYAQIVRDSRKTALKKLWGLSINYDELAKAIIVDPSILKVLAKTFQVQWISDRISHAGMEHTYGYLFSVLKTAFGYKRARWVHADTERGFGLPEGTLSPNAPTSSGGTLFSNVTYFFGRIAFRNEPTLLKQVKHHSSGAAKALRDFNYSSLKPIRLEEAITEKKVVLRTDLVPYTNHSNDSDAADANQYLLVYSVVTDGQAKLITGFPVAQSFVDSTLSKEKLGDQKTIVTQYNAFVPGVSGSTFLGTRRIVE